MGNGLIINHQSTSAPSKDVMEGEFGYSITISESAQASCGGTTCQCNGCLQLDCPMAWTTFTALCSASANVCHLYYPGGEQWCSFQVGQSCTLPCGVCSVTATAG